MWKKAAVLVWISGVLFGCDPDLWTSGGGGSPDAGSDTGVDTGPDASSDTGSDAPTDVGPDACAPWAAPSSSDYDRVVLIGHPFGEATGESGTEVRSMTLRSNGELVDTGFRFDVGGEADEMVFLPSGELVLVLTADGLLSSYRVEDARTFVWVDEVQLPSAGYGQIVLAEQAQRIHVVGRSSTESGGISTLRIDCDGFLEHDAGAFYPLRLAGGMVLYEGEERAIIAGGQASFEPLDDDDLRVLDWRGDGWSEVAAYDFWEDSNWAPRIALSPDERTLLVPNALIFSEEASQVRVFDVDGERVRLTGELLDLFDVQRAEFAPDGRTALVTMAEPGEVAVLEVSGGEAFEVDRIDGIGLADRMAWVRVGALSGMALFASVDPSSGSNVSQLRVEGVGRVRDEGQVGLGSGGLNIPFAIGVQP